MDPMMNPAMRPAMSFFGLPAATHAYLERSARALCEAITTSEVTLRYAHAHVAALRATAALLAARAHPAPIGGRRRGQQKNAWVLLAEVAPELSEWAAFFASGAAKRAAAEAGSRRAVTEREADDLVREADRFLGLVEQSLGLAKHVPFQEFLPTALQESTALQENTAPQEGAATGGAPKARGQGADEGSSRVA